MPSCKTGTFGFGVIGTQHDIADLFILKSNDTKNLKNDKSPL